MPEGAYLATSFVAFLWAVSALFSDSDQRYVLALSRFLFFPYWAVSLVFLFWFSGLTLRTFLSQRFHQTRYLKLSTAGTSPTQRFHLNGSVEEQPPPYRTPRLDASQPRFVTARDV